MGLDICMLGAEELLRLLDGKRLDGVYVVASGIEPVVWKRDEM